MKDFLNSIGIILGAISVAASLIPMFIIGYKVWNIDNSEELIHELMSSFLMIAIAFTVLALTTVIAIYKFSKRSEKLNSMLKDLPLENVKLISCCEESDLILRKSFNGFHNIINEYKYLNKFMSNIVNDFENVTNDQIKNCLVKFSNFLNSVTTSASDFYSHYTNDPCSVTIKLVRDGNVKTLHRDMFSYRHRNTHDSIQHSGKSYYPIGENSSFASFTKNDERRTYYFCNDLQTVADEGNYKNLNSNWKKLYNATAVSPIWMKDLDSDNGENYMLCGFFCVDNFKGGLGDLELKNFSGVLSSILFTVFEKFEIIANIAQEKEIFDGKVKAFTHWNDN